MTRPARPSGDCAGRGRGFGAALFRLGAIVLVLASCGAPQAWSADSPAGAAPSAETAPSSAPPESPPPASNTTQPSAPAAPPPSSQTTQPSTPAAPPPAAQSPQPAAAPANLETLPADQARSVLGKKVSGPSGEDLGLIVDVLFDPVNQPRAAVIDFGGFLGVGTRKIAVDWRLLRFLPADPKTPIKLNLGRAELQAAPEYKEGAKTISVIGPPPESAPPQSPPPAPAAQ